MENITPAKTAEQIAELAEQRFELKNIQHLQAVMAARTGYQVGYKEALEQPEPEPVEPITPEALEKEGFAPSPMKDFWGKGHILVSCKNDKTTVWVYTVSENVAITARGVTTMQHIRQLIKLIG